jgi:hypothetical protein
MSIGQTKSEYGEIGLLLFHYRQKIYAYSEGHTKMVGSVASYDANFIAFTMC